MLERDVSKKICEFAKRNNIPYIRLALQPGVAAGWPDYVFLLPNGQTLWMEMKSTKGVATKLQKQRIATLGSLGHNVYVVNNPEYGISLLVRHSR